VSPCRVSVTGGGLAEHQRRGLDLTDTDVDVALAPATSE
jgi:hypothetical protein